MLLFLKLIALSFGSDLYLKVVVCDRFGSCVCDVVMVVYFFLPSLGCPTIMSPPHQHRSVGFNR